MPSIIVTVGPKSIDSRTLQMLVRAGATNFRINLSHSNPSNLSKYIAAMSAAGIPPSIDTQGAQLRVESLPDQHTFLLDDRVALFFGQSSHKTCMSLPNSDKYPRIIFNHPEAANQVEPGDLIKIDFDGLVVQLTDNHSSGYWLGTVVAESCS